MSSARRVVRALRRKEVAAKGLELAVVESVDPVAKVSRVLRSDGTTVDVYPDSSGRLPLAGKAVWLAPNGADVIVLGGEGLASGTFQSLGHDADPTGTGWGLYDDGSLIINSGVVRADLAANLFTTSEDDTAPRVVIDSPTDARRIQMFTGDVDELAPGYVQSQDDADQATVEIGSPEFQTGGAGKHALLRTGIDRSDGSTFVDAVADNVRSNGVSFSRPPYSSKRRVAAQGPLASSPHTSPTVALGNQVVVFDTDLHVNFESFCSYDGAGTFTFTKNGIYPVELLTAWQDSSGFGDGHRRYYVNENGTDRIIGNMAAAGNDGVNTVHTVSTDVLVPTDDPFTLQFKVGQFNGFRGALSFSGRCSIKRFSAY